MALDHPLPRFASSTDAPLDADHPSVDAARRRLLLGALAVGAGTFLPQLEALAQSMDKTSLEIAYPVDVPTWDPGALTIPAIQCFYETVFDTPLRFSPEAKLQARQVTAWKWLDDKDTQLHITLRDDILFHDGTKMTMDDVRFSFFERPHGDSKLMVGNVFPTLIDVRVISPTEGVLVYRRSTPTGPLSLGFLAGYVVPKAYFTQVGIDGFNAKPIGAGPYRVADYQRGSRIHLEAFDKYWGGPPPIKNITFEITVEPASRVALIESGRVQMATQLPVRELPRLAAKKGITTKAYPVSEIYMMRIPSYVTPLDNDHVRAAMAYSIDKVALSKAFYAGVARPLSMMATPATPSYDPNFNIPYDPKKAIAELKLAGYGPGNPARFTFLSTNGTFPSDYDMARAIVQMWRQVGIEVDLQETTPPKLVELAQSNKLPGCLLYSWANSTEDPENYAAKIFDPRFRSSTWKDMSLVPRIEALLVETDEAKRIAGYTQLNRESSEKNWAIPLLQAIGTMAYASDLKPVLFDSGYILPDTYSYK